MNSYYNTAAFAQPAPFTFGNVPRTLGAVRGPGQANLDLSVAKYFPITERIRLQFRAESFNTLNHPRFGLPGTAIGSAMAQLMSSRSIQPRPSSRALPCA